MIQGATQQIGRPLSDRERSLLGEAPREESTGLVGDEQCPERQQRLTRAVERLLDPAEDRTA
jgi:hypothetical protein